MPYTSAEGRAQLLDTVAAAIDRLGVALASLTELYELLDELSADAMEERLFRPVQHAYGRARHAYASFSQRSGLPEREFASAVTPAPALGVKGLLDGAVGAIGEADQLLAELQDSMLPVEVGDVELRRELEQVRSLLSGLAARARELQRTRGR